jgi:hypothetical protein
MSFRNLDSAHDWTWGANKSNYVTANQEIGLNLETRILSFLGDCFFATNEGIDWFNLLDYHYQDRLENAVQETVKNTDGVTAINSVDSIVNADRKIRITYDVQTIYSQSYTGAVTPPGQN